MVHVGQVLGQSEDQMLVDQTHKVSTRVFLHHGVQLFVDHMDKSGL